jgi:hypothetical protein
MKLSIERSPQDQSQPYDRSSTPSLHALPTVRGRTHPQRSPTDSPSANEPTREMYGYPGEASWHGSGIHSPKKNGHYPYSWIL